MDYVLRIVIDEQRCLVIIWWFRNWTFDEMLVVARVFIVSTVSKVSVVYIVFIVSIVSIVFIVFVVNIVTIVYIQ